jgi:hypothetical protein
VSTTQAVDAGNYAWELRASLAGAVYPIAEGQFVVVANAAIAANTDARTFAEKNLAAIEAELAARITGDGSAHDAYVIHGRQLSKLPLAELRKMRTIYSAEVQRQRNGGRLAPYAMTATRPS